MVTRQTRGFLYMDTTDLFATKKSKPDTIPLALRMTPQNLDEIMGQDEILGHGTLLRRSIESDRLNSLIVYGPSGSGKSALARIIARQTGSHFEETNAVLIGIADIRRILEQAKLRLSTSSKKTILLLDEIHHFNKTQQDALLPDVEKGNITLIGITTENPYFYVNPALLSRSILFEFRRLNAENLSKIIDAALKDKERGLGNINVKLHNDARLHLIHNSNGDARRMLNALEIGVLSSKTGKDGALEFDISTAEASLQKKYLSYDKAGDEHYDHISAFIKSMRGSDPDAALYWMSLMLAAGEDPLFIIRRVIICASEDVGNADPRALLVAASALQAIEFVGMPEGRIPLAQAVVYVATAPKSNASYMALTKAMAEAAEGKHREVPNHLKDANMDGESRGHGKGYKYPHDYPGHYVEQDYWSDKIVFYEPSGEGYEIEIGNRLSELRKKGKTAQPNEAKKR